MITQGKRKPPATKKSINFVAFFKCETINNLKVSHNNDHYKPSINITAEDFLT